MFPCPETALRCLTPLSAVPFSLVPVVPSSMRPIQQILGVFEFVAAWTPWCMLTRDAPAVPVSQEGAPGICPLLVACLNF